MSMFTLLHSTTFRVFLYYSRSVLNKVQFKVMPNVDLFRREATDKLETLHSKERKFLLDLDVNEYKN
jgi:hypothetical protein